MIWSICGVFGLQHEVSELVHQNGLGLKKRQVMCQPWFWEMKWFVITLYYFILTNLQWEEGTLFLELPFRPSRRKLSRM